MDDNRYPFTVLFVEDEKALRENYVTYLQMFFREVHEAQDGNDGYEVYLSKKPDIMIIDIHLPKLSGLDLLAKIRKTDHSTKAIMLTAHTDKVFLLQAAELKLTKYLTKPISRKGLTEALDTAMEELSTFSVSPIKKINLKDNYSWDCNLKELRHYATAVELTPKEKKLLELLFLHKERIFTYDEIFEYVWGYDEIGTIDALKSLVKNLRKKIPKESIKNVFAIGYKINF